MFIVPGISNLMNAIFMITFNQLSINFQDEDKDEDLVRMWAYLDIGSDGYMSEDQFKDLMQSDIDHHL